MDSRANLLGLLDAADKHADPSDARSVKPRTTAYEVAYEQKFLNTTGKSQKGKFKDNNAYTGVIRNLKIEPLDDESLPGSGQTFIEGRLAPPSDYWLEEDKVYPEDEKEEKKEEEEEKEEKLSKASGALTSFTALATDEEKIARAKILRNSLPFAFQTSRSLSIQEEMAAAKHAIQILPRQLPPKWNGRVYNWTTSKWISQPYEYWLKLEKDHYQEFRESPAFEKYFDTWRIKEMKLNEKELQQIKTICQAAQAIYKCEVEKDELKKSLAEKNYQSIHATLPPEAHKKDYNAWIDFDNHQRLLFEPRANEFFKRWRLEKMGLNGQEYSFLARLTAAIKLLEKYKHIQSDLDEELKDGMALARKQKAEAKKIAKVAEAKKVAKEKALKKRAPKNKAGKKAISDEKSAKDDSIPAMVPDKKPVEALAVTPTPMKKPAEALAITSASVSNSSKKRKNHKKSKLINKTKRRRKENEVPKDEDSEAKTIAPSEESLPSKPAKGIEKKSITSEREQRIFSRFMRVRKVPAVPFSSSSSSSSSADDAKRSNPSSVSVAEIDEGFWAMKQTMRKDMQELLAGDPNYVTLINLIISPGTKRKELIAFFSMNNNLRFKDIPYQGTPLEKGKPTEHKGTDKKAKKSYRLEEYGFTPLMWAAKYCKDAEIIASLLKFMDADLMVKNRWDATYRGFTALQIAEKCENQVFHDCYVKNLTGGTPVIVEDKGGEVPVGLGIPASAPIALSAPSNVPGQLNGDNLPLTEAPASVSTTASTILRLNINVDLSRLSAPSTVNISIVPPPSPLKELDKKPVSDAFNGDHSDSLSLTLTLPRTP